MNLMVERSTSLDRPPAIILPIAGGFPENGHAAAFPNPEAKDQHMSKIQIICSKPGIRRNGIEHPAQAVYDAGHWTEEQLAAFRADPAFIVQEAAGSAVSSDDILAAVNARVEIERRKLQDSFNQAVADAVAEKLADTKAEHDNSIDALGKKLQAAEVRLGDLEAHIAKDAEIIKGHVETIADMKKTIAASAGGGQKK